MAFPANPQINDPYAAAGATYTWDGYKWVVTQSPYNVGEQGATGIAFGVFAFAKTNISAINGQPSLGSSNGIASVTRVTVNGKQVYRYVLRDAQPSANYTVQAAYTIEDDVTVGTSVNDWNILVNNITPTSFDVFPYFGGRSNNARPHSVVVYGVDAISGGGVDGPNPSGSAYNSWLRIGNVGTEPDFIDYITGATGIAGAAGAQGIQGNIGPDGPEGATGPRGDSIQLRGSVDDRSDLTDFPSIVTGLPPLQEPEDKTH